MELPVAGEIVRGLVPHPLPPEPAIDILTLLPFLRLGRPCSRPFGWNCSASAAAGTFSIHVCSQGSCSFVSDRRDVIDTLRSTTLRDQKRREVKPIDDIREVSNYVDAVMYGLERLAQLPLSLRLVREIHARLLRSGRGEATNTGEFRRTGKLGGGGARPRQRGVRTPACRGVGCLPGSV